MAGKVVTLFEPKGVYTFIIAFYVLWDAHTFIFKSALYSAMVSFDYGV